MSTMRGKFFVVRLHPKNKGNAEKFGRRRFFIFGGFFFLQKKEEEI